MPSKRLTQRYEVLGRLHTRNGSDSVTDVKANWTNRCVISKSDADGICVVVDELSEIYLVVDVAAIVENHAT